MVKLGLMSFAHMHAYSYAKSIISMPGVQLAGIWDDDIGRGQEASLEFNSPFYENQEELLSLDIDGVIICSENSKHSELTINAAKYKKHVLCEKPISTNIKAAWEMISACKEANVMLSIAFPCRFHPATERVREIIKEDKLGRIVAIRATNHGKMPGGWFIDKEKAGGGAVMDHTVHVVDLIRWFLNEEVVKVYGEGGNLLYNMDIDDSGLLSLEMESGTFATLDCSWSRPAAFPTWGDVTMEVVGTKGTAYLDMFAQNINIYKNSDLTTSYENWGSDADYHLIRNFVEAVEENKQPLVTGLDGLKAMEVALAAYESIRERKAVAINT